ncbi:hypothetical protein P167DRAFT_577605 [Morchella conica CCBAS932]|uniref:Nephrocystin 3-like N-terminal domain-containing protein n=1 Tax=Morchella conica CCBAS932 TaxID=1392247 RepID=A0A3N4KF65_9PEZI|nr:hypothetical protein P167DRAFT_577605 [Morchella conica CCBAS932]
MANPPTPVPAPLFTTSALLQLTLEATPLCYFYLGHLCIGSSSLSKIVQITTEEFRVCHGAVIAIGGFASANPEFKKGLGRLAVQVDKCMVDLQALVSKLKKRTRRVDWRNVRKCIEGWKELLLGVHSVLEKSAKEASQEPKVKARDYRSEVIESYFQRRAEIQELGMKIEASSSQPERQQILDWIYPEIYSKKHTATRGKRHGDIGAWILTSPDFLNWVKAKNDRNSQLLWGYGIAGSEKTFLSSIIVDHLLDIASISNYGVAYIYFDHEEQSTHDTTSVLASIVRQLLSQLPVLPDRAGKLHETYNPLKYDSLYNLFLSASSFFTNTFIICDALGERGKGDREQRKLLLTLLCRMAGAPNVFLTSRENISGDIQNTLDFATKIELRAREEDIKIYAEHRVSDSLLANRLYGKELYRERIVSDIGECAKGI